METEVKCECGKLIGTAKVHIGKHGNPGLSFSVIGFFFMYKSGAHSNLPHCSECKKPVMGNDWK